MRPLAALPALFLLLLLPACGGEDGGSSGDAFTAKGDVTIIGADKAQVLAADGAAAGDKCQGTGNLSDFSEGDEVVVLDADGSKVAVGKLAEGTLSAEAADLATIGLSMCELTFTVEDIPATDELLTLRIGEKEVTFGQEDADDLAVDVAGDAYP